MIDWPDDWLANGLPTRDGGMDRGAERVALTALGGPSGFKTREEELEDGTILRVQTKGTMPPQITYIAPEAASVTPEEEVEAGVDWRLWHGLCTAGAQGSLGEMPLRDWGEGAGYEDGDVISAYPIGAPEPIGFYGPGSTYHSNFAVVTPEAREVVDQHTVGDYVITSSSHGPYDVGPASNDETKAKTNDPFELLPSGTGAYCWRWRDPADDTIHWLRLYCADEMNTSSASGTMVFRLERVVSGQAPVILSELSVTNKSLFGDTVRQRYAYRVFVTQIQHSASGRTGLLMISRQKFETNPEEDDYIGTKPLWAVIRANVSGRNNGAINVFKTYDQLHTSESLSDAVSGSAGPYAVALRVHSSGSYRIEGHSIQKPREFPYENSYDVEGLIDAVIHSEQRFELVAHPTNPPPYRHEEVRGTDVAWYFFAGESETPDEVKVTHTTKNNLDAGYLGSGSVTTSYDGSCYYFNYKQSITNERSGQSLAQGTLNYEGWYETSWGTEIEASVSGQAVSFPLISRYRQTTRLSWEGYSYGSGLAEFPNTYTYGWSPPRFPEYFGSQPNFRLVQEPGRPGLDAYTEGSASWDISLTPMGESYSEPPVACGAGGGIILRENQDDSTGSEPPLLTWEFYMANNNVAFFSYWEYTLFGGFGAKVELPGTRKSFLISKTGIHEVTSPERPCYASWNPRTGEFSINAEREVQWL
jgi:hypothetical protein